MPTTPCVYVYLRLNDIWCWKGGCNGKCHCVSKANVFWCCALSSAAFPVTIYIKKMTKREREREKQKRRKSEQHINNLTIACCCFYMYKFMFQNSNTPCACPLFATRIFSFVESQETWYNIIYSPSPPKLVHSLSLLLSQ